MAIKREIEIKKLLYIKSELIKKEKKEVKKLRKELNDIQRGAKWKS